MEEAFCLVLGKCCSQREFAGAATIPTTVVTQEPATDAPKLGFRDTEGTDEVYLVIWILC
jgi:hypothetical protein